MIAEAGGATALNRYGPCGEPATWTGGRVRYTGQIALPEAPLYHYKARVYDPVLGRFLQSDADSNRLIAGTDTRIRRRSAAPTGK